MPKRSFLLFLRSLLKNKFYTSINIIGLAVAICGAFVIYSLIDHEYSFNKATPDSGRIYRLIQYYPSSGSSSGVSGPMSKLIAKQVSGVSETALIIAYKEPNVSIPSENGGSFKLFSRREHAIFTDQRYFNLFPRKWIDGDHTSSLTGINQVVLAQSVAKLYFPALDYGQMIGKTVKYNDTVTVTVSGIVEDVKESTDLNFDEFVSLRTYTDTKIKSVFFDMWDLALPAQQLFLKLDAKVRPAAIERQLSGIEIKNSSLPKSKLDDLKETLQPLDRLHLEDDKPFLNMRLTNTGNLAKLALAAVILLLLACVNYINLATARANHKSKEIGIRKILGESRGQLIFSFLTETFCITTLAAIVALASSPLVSRAFTGILPLDLSTNPFSQPHVIIFIPCLILVVTVLAGIYPALVVSASKSTQLLNGEIGGTKRSINFKVVVRKYLTTAQFVLSQLFIIATLIVSMQADFGLTKDPGFRKERIVNFKCPSDIFNPNDTRVKTLADNLRLIPQIQAVSISSDPPAEDWGGYSGSAAIDNLKKGRTETEVVIKTADSNYIGLYRIKLIAGHNITSSDSSATCLINRSLATTAGFADPSMALGQTLTLRNERLTIVGVIKDFNQAPISQPISPLVIRPTAGSRVWISVLMTGSDKTGSDIPKCLARIQDNYDRIYPGQTFRYTFFDETINAFYEKERNASLLLKWASGISMLISSLGLLALAQFTTDRRKKEIGIRKVLGASNKEITVLLLKNFLSLILISFLVAAPLSILWAHAWLANFAFPVSLSPWNFLIVELIIFSLSILTVSYFVWKAAQTNPVLNLRSE